MNPRPQTQIYITYVIPNPSEASTFFPQAVVKNTKTGATVATVNLTQDANNSLRYTGSFMAPADSTGDGYYLDVITTPYTDAGHTAASQNYWAATNQYFVYQAPSNYGGGYMELTPKVVREIVEENIRSIKFPEPQKITFPEFPEIPAPVPVDLKPVLARLTELEKAHGALAKVIADQPQFEPTDLSTLEKRLERLETLLSDPQSRGELASAISILADDLKALQARLKEIPAARIELTLPEERKHLSSIEMLRALNKRYG